MQLADQQVDVGADRVIERELYHEAQFVEEAVEFSFERSETRVEQAEALLDASEYLCTWRASVRTNKAPEEIEEWRNWVPNIDYDVEIRQEVHVDMHILDLYCDAIQKLEYWVTTSGANIKYHLRVF